MFFLPIIVWLHHLTVFEIPLHYLTRALCTDNQIRIDVTDYPNSVQVYGKELVIDQKK